jgi:uncharacterized protein (DUF58 family)
LRLSEKTVLPPDVVRQLRRVRIRARRAVDSLASGKYRSIFRGSGLAFEEVREYQPGDDIRTIDWNVTARMGHPFIKRHIEEREQTVFLLLDLSGSQQTGAGPRSKREAMAELAAVLALGAVRDHDRVGLMLFTDRVEVCLRPSKSNRHALRLVRDILFHQPREAGTSLRTALDFLARIQRRRAVIFLFSDFIDSGYERSLRGIARRHDCIAVRVSDPLEHELPRAGLVQFADPETGSSVLVDTSSLKVRTKFAQQAVDRTQALRRLIQGAGAELLDVRADGSHLDSLARFLRLRNERRYRL